MGELSSKEVGLFALGGVHGAVTLALAFSLVGQGISEATFDFVMGVEAVVIIFSMLVPTLVFKIMLPKNHAPRQQAMKSAEIKKEMVQVGLNAVADLDLSEKVRRTVIYDLQDQISRNGLKAFFHQWLAVNRDEEFLSSLQSLEQKQALMLAFNKEREYLYLLEKNQMAETKLVYQLYSEVLLSESLVLDPVNRVV